MSPPQKHPDLCGPTAWNGGIAAVNDASPKDRLYFYVCHRLRAIAKIRNLPDPTRLMDMNFEAMLLAIEQMSPIDTMTFDFKALRGLYAKHNMENSLPNKTPRCPTGSKLRLGSTWDGTYAKYWAQAGAKCRPYSLATLVL